MTALRDRYTRYEATAKQNGGTEADTEIALKFLPFAAGNPKHLTRDSYLASAPPMVHTRYPRLPNPALAHTHTLGPASSS